MKHIVNPLEIPKTDLPLITLSDQTSGLIASFIKIWTRAYYNHIMWLYKVGFFASQGNIYSKVSAKRYMKKGMRLKFWQIIGLTDLQKNMIIASIEKKLALPWRKRLYDFVGIFGQAIKLRFINVPWLDYCSEDVPEHAKVVIPEIDEEFAKVLEGIPVHGSPEDLNRYFKKRPKYFRVYGKWDSDDVKV